MITTARGCLSNKTRARASGLWHVAFGGLLCLASAACSAADPGGASRPSGAVAATPTSPGGTAATSGGSAGRLGTDNANRGLLPTSSAGGAAPSASAGSKATVVQGPNGAISIDETGATNPAGLSEADAQKLIAGGPLGNLKWLYPYEGTVFPRGLVAPTLMWDGAAADAVYLRIKSRAFEYKGCLKPTSSANGMAPQLQLPQDLWDKAGQHTYGSGDDYTVELSVRAGGAIAGPIVRKITIAQATIKGSIYYNTYASSLPGAAVGGNVLRIPPGGKAEVFLSSTCNGCHSLSADGSRMISQIGIGVGGNSFQLMSGGAANPAGVAVGPRAGFGALYPDGSKYLATSVAVPVGHADLAQGIGASPDAALYDTTTGAAIPDTGIPTGALMPMFSPDGTRLVFNDNAIKDAHGLAIMDYDVHTNKAAGYKVLTQEEGSMRPGWPFFLPDGKAVIFVRTEGFDFTGNGAYVGAGNLGGMSGNTGAVLSVAAPASELHIVEVASGTTTLLARAMGYDTPQDAASNKTYLPFGAEDLHLSYFPTVSPVAAGGYFWVFFDSIRHYGNLGIQRQLWGAAVDIQANGSYKLDPSHPPFYVPGQEFGAGNHRAFAALDPCKKDGDSCTSGIDCCGGTCSLPPAQEFVEAVGKCAPPPQHSCAKRDERCSITGDCCPAEPGQPSNSCIAGFCAYIPLN